MAGDSADASKLTGLNKYFNGSTVRGRANVALATYVGVGLIAAYFILKPKKAKQEPTA